MQVGGVHLYTTWYDTSTRERELRARIAELPEGDLITWMHETHRLEWDAVTSYSQRKAAAVFATLARNRTRVVQPSRSTRYWTARTR